MKFKIETGINLKYTDENGTAYFCEGDKVTCCTGGNKYSGTITVIGRYLETPDAEPQTAIYIDTSKSNTSRSGEIVKIKDITSIVKNPFSNNNILKYRQNLMDMFIEKGYSGEWAEVICDRWNDAVTFYNIPVVKAAAYAIQAVGLLNKKPEPEKDNDSKKDKLFELAKECSSMAAKEYFEMLDMYIRAMEQGGKDAYLHLEDTLDIASKCWNDLVKQSAD